MADESKGQQSFVDGVLKHLNVDRDVAITFVSGSVSGFAATFAKQPIQRAKWIRQVHEGPTAPGYRQIINETLAKRGVKGLFGGSMAAIYRNVPHSMLAYSIYPKAEAAVLRFQRRGSAPGDETSVKKSFSTRFMAGYVTILFTTMITHPLDTLRVRLSVFTDAAAAGAYKTGRAMYQSEGFGAFYRGFNATLIGAGPRGALGFGIFETMKPAVVECELFRDSPGVGKFLCGYVAGFLSEVFIYPLDTVRRRQQALGDATSIGRSGTVASIRHIAATEGVRGLFKGILMNLLKNPLATAVSFLVNDLVKDALGYTGESELRRRRSAGGGAPAGRSD